MSNPAIARVFDKNMVDHEDGGHWLAASRDHVAVLSDFCMLESYSGDAVKNVTGSFSVLRHFPKQVVLMIDNNSLRDLPPNSNPRHQLIDWDRTEDFRLYLMGASFGLGDRAVKALRENQKTAQEKLDEITKYVPQNRKAMADLEPQIRQEITSRNNGVPTVTEAGRNKIIEISARLVRAIDKDKHRDDRALFNSFTFRYAVSAMSIMAVRISHGSISDVSDKKMRNDGVDANHMACSTYFDGFMTADAMTAKAYAFMTETIFRVADKISQPF